jgi:hypothetical protein
MAFDPDLAEWEAVHGNPAALSAPSVPDQDPDFLEWQSSRKVESTPFAPYQGPKLFDDPIAALTSADWWTTRPNGQNILKDPLTRPDGTKITAEQAVVGPTSRALDALTFGAGDEITAGGAALLGGDYDQELAKVRGYQQSFQEASPAVDIGLQLAAGLKVPVPAGKMTVAKTAGLGAAYGGAYGFGEGEGGLDNRLAAAEDDAKIGAALGGVLGLGAKGVQSIAKNAPDIAAKLQRRSIGARQGDYAKTANEIGITTLPDGNLETLTKSAVDDLIATGKLGKSREPTQLLQAARQGEKEIDSQIARVVNQYDKNAGAPVFPQFENAMQYLTEGKVPADKVDDYFKRLAKLSDNIKAEGQGKLSYLQQQKIAQGALFDPNDSALNGFNRAIYYDLQGAIESKIPEISALNKESQKFKLVKPILQRNLAITENQDGIEAIKGFIKTTGGYGTLATAGGLSGGLPGVVGGLAAGKLISALNSPAGKKNVANVLSGLGSAAAKAPQARGAIAPLMAGITDETIPSKSLEDTKPKSQQTESRRLSLPLQNSALTQGDNVNRKEFETAIKPPERPDPILTPIPSQLNNLSKPERIKKVADFVEAQPPLIKAIIKTESSGDPFALSPTGPQGLMQLTRLIGKAYGAKDRWDPKQNVEAGTKFLQDLAEKYDDPKVILAAYNQGETQVNKAIKKAKSTKWEDIKNFLTEEGQTYPDKVIGNITEV